MKWFRNVSLAKKLCGLVGVPLVLMTFVLLSSASSGFGSTQTLVLLAVAVVLSASLAFVTAHQLRGAVEAIVERMAAVEKAAKGNLVTGLNALSVGDLTGQAAGKDAGVV
jgi:hypothetical protein